MTYHCQNCGMPLFNVKWIWMSTGSRNGVLEVMVRANYDCWLCGHNTTAISEKFESKTMER